MNQINTVNKILDKIEFWICVVLVFVLLGVATSSVLSRYVFHFPLDWAEELCRFMYMWLIFFASAFAIHQKASLAIDFIPATLLRNKPLAQKIIRIINDIGFILFCVFMMKRGWNSAVKSIELSAAMHLPMNIVYMCMPVGSFFMTIRLLQDIYSAVTGREFIADNGIDTGVIKE